MRLKRVRIFGFKTFADRTEFSLEGGVVAVVGPNGCGKSNLVDAILWGLGEGNSRHLRAATSQDVIFSGSSNRKPVGFAEVNLLFDNEDGALPVDTPEVSINRKLNRSGDSEYSINKQPCRLRDIYDLLADSGLGRAGYAIVGQKEIDSALSASAEDRRAWVDEAAGVQRYRARKVESQRRLASANDHLSRVADILRELEGQREPLREEAEIAQRYKSLVASLREIEIGLLVDEIARAIAEIKEQEARLEDSAKVSHSERLRAESLDRKVQDAGFAISELERELDTIRSLQQGSLTAIERSEANRRLLEQRLASLSEQGKSLADDGEGVAKRIAEAEAENSELRRESEGQAEALANLQIEVAGAGEESQRLRAILKKAESELETGRAAHARRLRLEAAESHAKDRKKQVEREIKGIDEAIPELEEAIAGAQAEFERLAKAGEDRHGAIKAAEAKLLEIRQAEERDAQNVRKSLADKASLEGRRRGIEATIDAHEGLTQGSRAVLEAVERNLIQGEYIAVGEAVETDREYALAIETALGASSNDLICADQSEAKRAIEWLKHHRAGRATFQPIPLMRPVEPSFELRRLLGEKGILGRASELVSCRGAHRPVIDSLLGRVVIVEDLDTALRFAKTSGWSRMVTLDGEVVHGSGAVTGGQTSRQGYGVVQRKADLAELGEQLEKLEKVVREFDTRSSRRNQDRLRVEAEIAAVRTEMSASQGEINEARSYLQTLSDEKRSSDRSREKLIKEIEALDAPAGEEVAAVDIPALEGARDAALRELAGKSADAEQAEIRLREGESLLHQARARLQAGERRLSAAREAEDSRAKRLQNLEPEKLRIQAEREVTEAALAEAMQSKADADRRFEKAQIDRRGLLEESLRLSEEAKAARANAQAVADAAHHAELARTRAESKKAASLQRIFEEYSITEEEAIAQQGQHEVPLDATSVVARFRREIRSMGDVNLGAIEAFERLSTRFDELEAQQNDILEGIAQVESGIRELDKLTRDRFMTTFAGVEVAFSEMFQKLFGGGEGRIALTDPEHVLDTGIDLLITLPGKKRQPLQLLSGGERSLSAMAFLFALLKVKPSPLVVLDEVDAPLDGRNVERFAETLRDFTDNTQFIVITHNQTTMESANVLLGVTMQDPGISMLVPAQLPS